MPRKRLTSHPVDRIERDFLSAIERLEQKAPLLPSLQSLARTGRLKINKSTVAIEAGHSRTKIYDYPRVIANIIGEQTPTRTAKTAMDVISKLRKDNAELKQERNAALSALASLTLRIHQERKDNERKLKEMARSAKYES